MNLKKREFLLTAFGKRITYCTLLFCLSNKILSQGRKKKAPEVPQTRYEHPVENFFKYFLEILWGIVGKCVTLQPKTYNKVQYAIFR